MEHNRKITYEDLKLEKEQVKRELLAKQRLLKYKFQMYTSSKGLHNGEKFSSLSTVSKLMMVYKGVMLGLKVVKWSKKILGKRK